MKKTIIAAITAITLTAGAISSAVYAHSDKGGPGKGMEKLTQNLNLTAEQQAEIQKIFDQRMLDRKNMLENTSAEQRENLRENAREGMKAQMESQIKALLTPEQVALFDKMHAEKEGKGGHEKGKRGQGEGKGEGQGKRGGKDGENCNH